MEVKDLRIGNLLEDGEGRLCRVEEISLNEYKSYSIRGALTTYPVKPIPITEEWLLKFGFTEKYKSCHSAWTLNGFTLHQASDEDEFGNSIPVKQKFSYEFKLDIKYVHSLQNLYFALMGSELIIKSE